MLVHGCPAPLCALCPEPHPGQRPDPSSPLHLLLLIPIKESWAGPESLQVLLKVWNYLVDPFKSTGHGQYQIPVWEKRRAAVATPCSEGGKTPHRGASPSERLGNIPPTPAFRHPIRSLQKSPAEVASTSTGSGTPTQRGPTQWGPATVPDALLCP